MGAKKERIKPIHPGEILVDEFLVPMGISQYRLAKETHVSPMRISEIVNGKRGITADTALRFSVFFGNSAKFWMNLQTFYDMACAKQKLGDRIIKEIHPWAGNSLVHA